LVVIAGGNGEGKSSFIDAISQIFDPTGVRLTPKPLRIGETEGFAEVVTSTARIRRTWKKDDAGTLEAFPLDPEARYAKTGKQFVAESTGGAIFDPEAFANLADDVQRQQLLARSILPEGFNLAKLDADYQIAYDDRRAVTRTLKEAGAALTEHPEPAEGTPTEEVSAAAILAEHEQARQVNAEVERKRAEATRTEAARVAATEYVARVEAALATARGTAEHAAAEAAISLEAARVAVPVDLDAITAKLSEVESINAAVRAGKAHAAAKERVAAVQAREDELNASMAAIVQAKVDGLKAAVFPVAGLGVDDVGVTFQGVPFKQVNSAEKVLIALDLLTIPQPDLRIVIIKNGDMLDANTLAKVDARATERGYLVVTERDRDESRQIGWTVTGGTVSA
jgi:hypothetical protein